MLTTTGTLFVVTRVEDWDSEEEDGHEGQERINIGVFSTKKFAKQGIKQYKKESGWGSPYDGIAKVEVSYVIQEFELDKVNLKA